MNRVVAQRSVAHLWGMSALSWSDLAQADFTALKQAGTHIDTVLVPSHWGDCRATVVAEALVGADFDPYILRLCDAVALLEASAARYSFLIELHPDSVSVTLLSWAGSRHQTVLTHAIDADDREAVVETIIALSYAMVAFPGSDLDAAIADEAVGTAGITQYPSKWQSEVEYIVADYPPGVTAPRGFSVVELLHSRRFRAFELPVPHLAEAVGSQEKSTSPMAPREEIYSELEFYDVSGSDVSASVDMHARGSQSPRPVSRLQPSRQAPVAGARLNGQARGQTRSQTRGPAAFAARHLRLVAAGATALLIAGCVAIFAVSSHRPAADDMSAQPTVAPMPPVAPPPQSSSPEAPLPQPNPAAEPPLPRLVAAGVQAEFPHGWSLDPAAPPDRLIALNGGEMRIIATVHEVAAGASLDDVVVRLSAASAEAEVSEISRSAIDGMEMVTHVERPASGQSVVLWHHRIEGQTQLSVGCQFRGAVIPAIRSDCDQVVRTAHPM